MSLVTLLRYLPELLELIHVIKERIEKEKLDRKVTDDLQAIKLAYSNNDINKLNELFNKQN